MMSDVTVLGLGAMGSRMAANLLKAGHAVTVWNRSPQAAEPLVAAGAILAATPKAAAEGAEVVIAMVRDVEASRELWLAPGTGAFEGLNSEALAIDSSTLTVGWIRELGAEAAKRGVTFLEAPVAGSRPQAEAAQLIYFVGGDGKAAQLAEPVLKAIGTVINYVGPLGSGALVKLTTNALMGVQVTVLAELIGLLKGVGADPGRALKAIATTPVWSPAAGPLTATMLAGDFAPQFPVELIEKDFNYVLREVGDPSRAPTISAARTVFQRAIERGIGEDNMTGVVRLFTA
jgi:3-hydroxyisobutyrate dehydrogenase